MDSIINGNKYDGGRVVKLPVIKDETTRLWPATSP